MNFLHCFVILCAQQMMSEVLALKTITVCKSLMSGENAVCPAACRKRFRNLQRHCSDYLGDSKVCSKRCHKRFKKILQLYAGVEKVLRECDCSGDYNCITARARFLRCIYPDPEFKSCSALLSKCEKDENKATCGERYSKFFDSCYALYGTSKGSCTAQCKSSFNELLKDNIGEGFQHCTCDGSFSIEKFCLETTDLRKKLCKPPT